MIEHVNRTIGRIATDTRKVLVLGALLALAVGVMALSGPVPRVQAESFVDVIEAKLTASDGASSDVFGYSVSVDGDTAVVGA